MSDLKELETRIDRLHHLLRTVDDEAARQELERLLGEARRNLENLRRTATEAQLASSSRKSPAASNRP